MRFRKANKFKAQTILVLFPFCYLIQDSSESDGNREVYPPSPAHIKENHGAQQANSSNEEDRQHRKGLESAQQGAIEIKTEANNVQRKKQVRNYQQAFARQIIQADHSQRSVAYG